MRLPFAIRAFFLSTLITENKALSEAPNLFFRWSKHRSNTASFFSMSSKTRSSSVIALILFRETSNSSSPHRKELALNTSGRISCKFRRSFSRWAERFIISHSGMDVEAANVFSDTSNASSSRMSVSIPRRFWFFSSERSC